ncbi:MAG: biopolymer transporter ExbD [Spirochaetota bacterium]|jgi:biopolymer transport protein ExbD|nr:biopolymer transporter ExbD [Spirochaetota bacterium]
MAIKFNRRLKTKVVLDMAPMIDIVFQLIIFFMLATQVKVTTGMEFELPKAENLSNIAQTPLKITIISEKSIVVGSKKTNLANFSVVLSESTSADATAQKSVILYGNKSIEYELLIQVMDTLKECGYDSIDLALDRK